MTGLSSQVGTGTQNNQKEPTLPGADLTEYAREIRKGLVSNEDVAGSDKIC